MCVSRCPFRLSWSHRVEWPTSPACRRYSHLSDGPLWHRPCRWFSAGIETMRAVFLPSTPSCNAQRKLGTGKPCSRRAPLPLRHIELYLNNKAGINACAPSGGLNDAGPLHQDARPADPGETPDESRKPFRSARSALQGQMAHLVGRPSINLLLGPFRALSRCDLRSKHVASARPSDTGSGAGAQPTETPRLDPRSTAQSLCNARLKRGTTYSSKYADQRTAGITQDYARPSLRSANSGVRVLTGMRVRRCCRRLPLGIQSVDMH